MRSCFQDNRSDFRAFGAAGSCKNHRRWHTIRQQGLYCRNVRNYDTFRRDRSCKHINGAVFLRKGCGGLFIDRSAGTF